MPFWYHDGMTTFAKRLPPVVCLWLAALLFWAGGHLDHHGVAQATVTPASVAALLGISLLLFVLPQRALSWRRGSLLLGILLLLALLKGIAISLQPAPGLLARYYADNRFTPPHEVSWLYRDLQQHATRVDASLSFSPRGFSITEQTFPLHFVNDWHRFNWRENAGDDHRRKHFRFSTIWSGTLSIPDSIVALQWQAGAGEATLRIGTQAWYSDGTPEVRPATAGTWPLVAEYRRTRDDAPALDLRWSHDGKRFESVPPSAFSPLPGYSTGHSGWHTLHQVALAGWLLTVLAMVLMLVDWRRWRETRWERLVLLLLFALLSSAALQRQRDRGTEPAAQIFTAGNDWLRYETQARDILLGDWLNAAFTEGKPFFMNVGYPYWMAAMHALAGEDVLAVTWLQQMLMVAFLLLFYLSVRHAFGRPAGLLASGLLLGSGQILKFPSVLLDTTFSIVLAYGLLYSLIRWRRQPGTGLLLASALWLALAVITRANFLPFVAVAALWVAWPVQPGHRWQWPAAATLLAAGLLPVLLTGWRNAVVAGEWVWMPTSGSFNLWIGNHPPVGERFHPFDFPPIPPASEQGRIAIDYILSDPAAFFYRVGYKLAYLFGIVIYEARIAWNILLPTVLAFIGFVLALKRGIPFRQERLLLGLWVALNFGALCVIFPWVYGWRLSGPTLPAIAVLAALALQDGWRRLRARR